MTILIDADRRPVLIRTISTAKKAPARAGAFCWRRWWAFSRGLSNSPLG